MEDELLEEKTKSIEALVEKEVEMAPHHKRKKKRERWGWVKQNSGPRKDSLPHCPKKGKN